jgi:hypothetical protein
VVMARETGVCLGARVWVVLECRDLMTGKRLAAWGAASGGGGRVAARLCGAVWLGCEWVVALVAVRRGGCPRGGGSDVQGVPDVTGGCGARSDRGYQACLCR